MYPPKVVLRLLALISVLSGVVASEASAQQPNFGTCGTSLYLAQFGELIRFDTATNPFVFTTLGTASFAYNAVAFNPVDSYLYGVRDNTRLVVRIGSDGSLVDVGVIGNLPTTGTFGYNAGEMAPDGTFYVKQAGNNAFIHRVNLALLSATPIPLSRALNVADLAWHNGLLYTVSTDTGRLFAIDPATGAVTNVGATNAPGPFGALFGAPTGVYGSSNAGGFYQFDPLTGAGTLIAGSPGSSGNDGAKCATTPIDYPADISVVKSDGSATYTPGQKVPYTIVVSNAGPFGAAGVTIDDPLPAGITVASWTCGLATGGGACGVAAGVGGITAVPVNLPAGASVTFTLSVEVPANAAGPLVNTATATNPPGTPDPNPGNNTSTDVDNGLGVADLAITKSSTPNPYVPGAPFAYTIVVSNIGPSNVVGATVDDVLPAALAGFPWTCTGSGGAVCGLPGGTGPGISTTADIPAGGVVTIGVAGTLGGGTTGILLNTATVTPPPGVTDPVPGNNSATDQNPAGGLADLAITKDSAPKPFVPGAVLTYTLVATNAGPSNVLAARIQDGLPAAFAAFSWTCAGVGGAACATTTGTGNIDVLADMPAGTTVTITSAGTVPPGFSGVVTNTATIAPPPSVTDPVPGNNSSTSNNAPAPEADLSITKTQSPNPYTAGAALTYTLVVSNAGPSDATHARVQDVLPATLAGISWTCAPGNGASCSVPAGTNVVDTLVSMPAGSSVALTISATVPAGVTGVLTNTGTVTPPADVTDPNPGNNSSTVNSLAPEADLSIVKTATPNPYVPGQPLTYTLVVNNAGPSAVQYGRVQDALPAAMSGFTWTCTPSGGAECGSLSGATTIDVLLTMPAGASVTLTVTGTVPPTATGPQTNTATITPPPGITDPDPTNNTSTVTPNDAPQADLSITKTSAPSPYVAGSPVTYIVTVSNAGPSAVVGAHVRDAVPLALDNVTWTCVAVNATCAAGSGIASIDVLVDLDPGGTITFTTTGDVPATTTHALVNSASVVPPPNVIDPVPTNNSAVDLNPVSPILAGPADLQITQEFPGVAPPSGQLTFKLVTTNLGPNPALDPYITGMIPPGTTFVSATPSTGGTCLPPGNPPRANPVTGYPTVDVTVPPLLCTWPGLMQVGETHYVELIVQVAPDTPVGQILWSCFWTWSKTEDPYHPNNVVDAYLFVQDATTAFGDLGIQAATLSDGVIGTELGVLIGSTVPIRFWVTNHGPARARGQYALILDKANVLELVSASVPQGWFTPSSASSGAWDTGPVEPGQTVALDLVVRLRTLGAARLFAQRITGQPGDPNASNERATIVLDGHGPDAAGRWVAVGNLDAIDGAEIITGTGRGELPQVRVFNGLGGDTGLRFFVYEQTFLGGVQVASCDLDSDGIAEIVTAPGAGRSPTIRVLKVMGTTLAEVVAFDAFEADFLGGASVACADLDGDGTGEIVVGAGPGRAPEVRVYAVSAGSAIVRTSFLAFEEGFRGGVRVAAGHYPGRAGWLNAFDIAVTPGPGRPADLRLFGLSGTPVAQVLISQATKGVLPTLGDANGDGRLDLLVAPDDGRPELVRIFDVDSGAVVGEVPGGLPGFPGGVRLATGTLQGGPGVSELVVGNGAGGHPRVRIVFWPPSGPVQRLEVLPLEVP